VSRNLVSVNGSISVFAWIEQGRPRISVWISGLRAEIWLTNSEPPACRQHIRPWSLPFPNKESVLRLRMVFSQCCARSTFKSKGNVVTVPAEKAYGRVKIKLHSFLHSHQIEVNGQRHRPVPQKRWPRHQLHLLQLSRWERMSQVGYELHISDVRITICSSHSQQSSEIKSFFLHCSRHCACPSLYIFVLDPRVCKCGVDVIYISFIKYRRPSSMTNIFGFDVLTFNISFIRVPKTEKCDVTASNGTLQSANSRRGHMT
jgi:hypothetical protein